MTQDSQPKSRKPSEREADDFHVRIPDQPQVGSAEAMHTEAQLLAKLKRQGPRGETLKPLAVFYAQVGKQEAAYGYLKTWMRNSRDPEELAEALLMCGQLAEQVQQHKTAAAFYREALDLKPQQPRVRFFLHNNLSFCLGGMHEYEEAMAHARRAVELDPSRANAYKNLGVALDGLGRYVDAARMWLRALHVDASDDRALEHLEALAAAQGEALRERIPELDTELERCRRAVHTARRGRFADWAKGLTFN